jgi:predicted transposase YbfD/YdcC
MATEIMEHFADLPDPRQANGRRHLLSDIVTISICAVICGAEEWSALEEFGQAKEPWFRKFLRLPHGIPSADTFARVFAALDPEAFERCFISWINTLAGSAKGKLIPIDGKTLRHSFDRANGKAPIHMVSAWGSANRLCFGQLATDAKSNEITAIPKLLEMLELSGCLVTIDAMGCQTEIAAAIVDAGADYVLAVKANQPTLHDGIADFFIQHLEDDFAHVKASRHQTHETTHGRRTTREYFVCPVPDDLPDCKRWKKLKAIGMTINRSYRNGKETDEVRCYILSKKLSGRQFAAAARDHWGIENRLHWQLDVTFGEDQSRIRKGHADTNFSLVRRAALSLLKNNHGCKAGIKNKRLYAAANEKYLQEVLLGK